MCIFLHRGLHLEKMTRAKQLNKYAVSHKHIEQHDHSKTANSLTHTHSRTIHLPNVRSNSRDSESIALLITYSCPANR